MIFRSGKKLIACCFSSSISPWTENIISHGMMNIQLLNHLTKTIKDYYLQRFPGDSPPSMCIKYHSEFERLNSLILIIIRCLRSISNTVREFQRPKVLPGIQRDVGIYERVTLEICA